MQENTVERHEYLTFSVNDITFAINSLYIDSVTSQQDITKIPGKGDCVDGIIYLRGTTITVINLRKYLFNIASNENNQQFYVICRLNSKYIAFKVDSIKSIIRVNSIDIHPVDSLIIDRCSMLDGFITDSDKKITEILDIKHIMNKYNSEL